jgi:sRNA-binding protein
LFNNKIGRIEKRKEEEITAVVNNKNVDNKGGKMNITRNKNTVSHTIVNIPKDGIHLGVCVIFLIIFIFCN